MLTQKRKQLYKETYKWFVKSDGMSFGAVVVLSAKLTDNQRNKQMGQWNLMSFGAVVDIKHQII